MCKRWLLCVFLGALAWGQTSPMAPHPVPSGQVPGGMWPAKESAAPPPAPDPGASLPASTTVLTVTLKSSCPGPAKAAVTKTAATTPTKTAKPASGECKTVYTKEEFERLASAASPNMTPQLKRQLSNVLPRYTAMSEEAQKQGLDQTPRFKEMMKFMRMQALSQELQRHVQEEASKISDEQVAGYYKENPEAYEQFNLDRLFIPRFKQGQAEEDDEKPAEPEKDEKMTAEQRKAKEEKDKALQTKGEEEMTKLADALRERAAAGEDFTKLQKEAFAAAGMKIESPTVNLPKIRRTGLPQGHATVFDLKVGEISQAIGDAGGHYIYKINAKEQLPLDQVKDEITSVLKNQSIRDAMEKITNSYSVDTNEAYFGPPAPAGARPNMPMPPMKNPHMAPSAMAPAAQQAPTQPPAKTQPPAANPN
jgi:hypothetical protein